MAADPGQPPPRGAAGPTGPLRLTPAQVRAWWLGAQGLSQAAADPPGALVPAPAAGTPDRAGGSKAGGSKAGAAHPVPDEAAASVSEETAAGARAVAAVVEQLGYVQIDTIHVIERCHHHILHSRLPGYRRAHLRHAQSEGRSVFEYWTHAMAYVPTADLRFYAADMLAHRQQPRSWFKGVDPADVRRLVRRVRDTGPLSIRDITDDELVEPDHPWAGRKPSRRALQCAWFSGELTVIARQGMVKVYDLPERHFGWARRPLPLGARQSAAFRVDRALRAQAVVDLDSICYLSAGCRPAVKAELAARCADGRLREVRVEGAGDMPHWVAPATLEQADHSAGAGVHLLSPFDPVVIQRRRLSRFFGFDYQFEAYLPPARRVLGYFALPVLIGDRVVAAIDLKADRQAGRLLIQKWTWVGRPRRGEKALIEASLGAFETFQLAGT